MAAMRWRRRLERGREAGVSSESGDRALSGDDDGDGKGNGDGDNVRLILSGGL